MNTITQSLTLSLICLTLTACGDSSESDARNLDNKPAASASTLDGIYFAEGNDSQRGDFGFIAFVDDGKMEAYTTDRLVLSGDLEAKADQSVGTSFLMYNRDKKAYDGSAAVGQYKAKSHFDGRYETVSGATGAFVATYDEQAYHQPASLDIASGVWTVTNTRVSNAIRIDTQGDLYGTDADGCVYSGEVRVGKANRNMYRINLTIESCGGANGQYSGLAARGASDLGDTLMMLVSNDHYGFYFQLQRS